MTIIPTNIPNQKLINILNKFLLDDHSLGVDMSKWMGDTNFDILKKRGVHFAAFRTTIGNYYKDPMREIYFNNANAVNIHQTDYHVIRPDNSARSQMDNYFISRPSGDTPPILPVVLDNEIHGKSVTVWKNKKKKKYKIVYKKFPPSQITDRLLECKEIIEIRDGKTPMHYTYLYFLIDYMEDSREVWEMDQWIAQFGTLTPGYLRKQSDRDRLAALNGGKGIPITIWQCLADADDQGPYFGAGAHGLDIDLFMFGGNDTFDSRYTTQGPTPPPNILFPLPDIVESNLVEEVRLNRQAINELDKRIKG